MSPCPQADADAPSQQSSHRGGKYQPTVYPLARQAVLSDDTSVDARPSDALTLALVTDVPIYVAASVLKRADETSAAHTDLIGEANPNRHCRKSGGPFDAQS